MTRRFKVISKHRMYEPYRIVWIFEQDDQGKYRMLQHQYTRPDMTLFFEILLGAQRVSGRSWVAEKTVFEVTEYLVDCQHPAMVLTTNGV